MFPKPVAAPQRAVSSGPGRACTAPWFALSVESLSRVRNNNRSEMSVACLMPSASGAIARDVSYIDICGTFVRL